MGVHSEHSNLLVFNGLGARGILNGCYFSKSYMILENNSPLPPEVNMDRFIN
jgi:hypothetical protein